jgi:CHAT domain
LHQIDWSAIVIVQQPVEASAVPDRLASSGIEYDSLRIVLNSAGDGDGSYFQATLQQRGAVALGGPFRQQERFPVADVELLRRSYTQQLQMMHELAAAGVPVPPPDMRRLIDLGRRVAAVLSATTCQGIVEAVQRAQRQRRGLRITLEVGADDAAKRLLGIPWELMVLPLTRGAQLDTGGEGFLLLNADITLVRQVQGIGRNTTPQLTQPLKLQALVASPTDGRPIAVDATRAAIEQVLAPDTIQQCWYHGIDTLNALQERLCAACPQVLHLLCHGELSDTGQGFRSDLLFTHRDGYMRRVSAFDLAPALTLAPDLQLVVLQACHAGSVPTAIHMTALADGEAERIAIESIALTIVRQGVPAVVAMQGEVGQAAAAAFVQACYQVLGRGGSLDQAIAAGRIAMQVVDGLVDWSLPVVYQGSGRPDPHTWYTRLADHTDAALHDPSTRRSLRGGMVALALTLLVVGTLRWLLFAPPPPPTLDWLLTPLACWVFVGLVGPAVVAACHRGVRERHDLPSHIRRAAMRAQWMGAYLGYALGGALGLGLLVVLWAFGLLAVSALPSLALLLAGILLVALFLSYAAARSQVRSALAIAPFAPGLFGWSALGLVLVAALLITAAPLGLLLLPDTPLAFLLNPAPSAFALALTLITAVLRG